MLHALRGYSLKKTQLLVVAHGSRREASNDEVRALTKKLSEMSHPYHSVKSAFLELAEPSIPDGIRAAIRNGSTRVVVFPYFLSAGRHVTEDIPSEIQVVKDEYPEVDIQLASYLGSAEDIANLILNLVDGQYGTTD